MRVRPGWPGTSFMRMAYSRLARTMPFLLQQLAGEQSGRVSMLADAPPLVRTAAQAPGDK